MKYEKFTKSNLKEIRERINSKMGEIEKETGVNLTIGNISFSEYGFTTRLTAKIVSDNSMKAESENAKAEFELLAEAYGLKPGDYGKQIFSKGKPYTIIGIDTKKPKNAIVLEGPNGKAKASAEMVVAMLKIQELKKER